MHTQSLTHTHMATGAGVQRRFMSYAGTQAVAVDQIIGVPLSDYVAGQAVAVHVTGVVARPSSLMPWAAPLPIPEMPPTVLAVLSARPRRRARPSSSCSKELTCAV
jgi:hypothetical protein